MNRNSELTNRNPELTNRILLYFAFNFSGVGKSTILDRVLERLQSRGVLLTSDPLFGQEKCSVKCNSVFFANSERKLPYLFTYKAHHFFRENILVRSKSAQNSGCVL